MRRSPVAALEMTHLKTGFLRTIVAAIVLACITQFFPSAVESEISSPLSCSRRHVKKDCQKGRDVYGRLRSYCHSGNKHIHSLCVNDDGVCCSRCGKLDDNDCRILESLLSAHEFLLSRKSSQGYTPDPRDSLVNPKSEFYRLVPCMQAQGYLNLYACTGEKSFLDEACHRLDFIASRLREALSGTCYDGQIGRAFLDAYQMTCNKDYLQIGLEITEQSLTHGSRVLNWGLLAATSLLQVYEITGSELYLSEARNIVAQTLPFQNPDGSFPHQEQAGQRSLPYTSWLAYELISYRETDSSPQGLGKAIDSSGFLLARQLSADGSPRYDWDSLVVVRVPDPMCVKCVTKQSRQCSDYCVRLCEPSPEVPSPCWCITDPYEDCPYVDTLVNITYYDEEAANYDVRGWTSELPSTAFILDRTGRLEAKWKILGFLLGLQNSDGSFPDKWGFLPKPTDGMWKFASEEHSVIRTSCVFFYLSGLLRTPDAVGSHSALVVVSDKDVGRVAYGDSAAVDYLEPTTRVFPNPSSGGIALHFTLPPRVGRVELVIVDISGRTVKSLGQLRSDGGSSDAIWDGTDVDGERVAPGVYFAQVIGEGWRSAKKLVILGR
jgi:hypothetical protein